MEGSVAHFHVRRPSTGELIEFAVRRERIRTRSMRGFQRRPDTTWDFMIDPQHRIGYLRLSEFWDNTVEDLDGAVAGLAEQGVRALIVDVRFNPGGDLDVARQVAERFLSAGVIVSTKNRREVEAVMSATQNHTLPDWPVVVLVNSGSASASEILAGALQDHGRALIVGQRTVGKGSVQTVIELDDQQSALRLTTAYYYLPSGRLIHRRLADPEQQDWGITPDHVIELTNDEMVEMLDSWARSNVIIDDDGGKVDRDATPGERWQSIVIDRQLSKALELLRGDS